MNSLKWERFYDRAAHKDDIGVGMEFTQTEILIEIGRQLDALTDVVWEASRPLLVWPEGAHHFEMLELKSGIIYRFEPGKGSFPAKMWVINPANTAEVLMTKGKAAEAYWEYMTRLADRAPVK